MEFGFRVEQGQATTGAAIHARLLGIPIFAGKSTLGFLGAQDFELFRSQRLFPLEVITRQNLMSYLQSEHH